MRRGFAQADGSDGFADLREDKRVKMGVDETERNMPNFSVILPVIHVEKGSIEIEVFDAPQRDTMLTLIDGVFCRTVRYLHAF